MTRRWKKAIELGGTVNILNGFYRIKVNLKDEPPYRLHSKLDGYIITIKLTN
jgi:hypothetical protein